jgi:YD repeat-containing protein
MKYTFCLGILLLFTRHSFGQFYYQDIYSTHQTNENQIRLKNAKVRKVVMRSMDANRQLNEDFQCEETLEGNYRKTIAITNSTQTGSTTQISYYDERDHIVRSVDSSAISVSITTYQYDSTGNLVRINFDAAGGTGSDSTNLSESHEYFYKANNAPDKMVRKKNGRIFSVVNFDADSMGRIIRELETIGGKIQPAFYYKYGKIGYLSDIYQFNAAQNRMLATNMFNYNDKRQISDMTSVLSDTAGFNVWKYYYDDKALILKEECYQKGNELLGIIQFTYSFRL